LLKNLWLKKSVFFGVQTCLEPIIFGGLNSFNHYQNYLTMRKILLLLTGFAMSALVSQAQITDISVEVFYQDGVDAPVTGYPAGHTTYRIYANMTNETDVISTVFGSEDAPLVLQVPGGIWNSELGGVSGGEVSCSLYELAPSLEYDSYVTLNRSCDSDFAGSSLLVVQSEDNQWASNAFGTGNTATEIILNDAVGGAWVSPPGQANTVAGPSRKILLAQITTNSSVCGIFSAQVFANYTGVGSAFQTQNIAFGSIDCGIPGCTDPEAINYNSEATFENNLCLYECSLAWSGLTVSAPTCAGLSNGSIAFTGTGAQGFVRHSYLGEDEGLTAQSFTGLANGSYALSIEDTRFNNELLNPGGLLTCRKDTIISLNTLAITFDATTTTALTCAGLNDGSADGSASGGTGALSFEILNNAGMPLMNDMGNPIELSSPDFLGLAGGVYSWRATDENGCVSSSPNFTVTAPAVLNVIAGNNAPASCFNTSDGVQVIAWSGGTGDVDFSLEDDGVYDIEGNPSNAIFNLAPGSYTIYAADVNGCQDEVQVTITGPSAIVLTPTISAPSCTGDGDATITLGASGGSGSYLYDFDNGGLSIVIAHGPFTAGSHTVVVQDSNGCTITEEIVIEDPAALTATAVVASVSCNGENDGSFEIVGAGGTGEYQYSSNGVDFSSDNSISDLAPGLYSMYITDANGCEFSSVESISIEEPVALTSSSTLTNVSCNGAGDGSVVVDANGGTEPYAYSIGGGFGTNNSFVGLAPGAYTVSVLDANDCQTTQQVNITQPAVITVNGLTADGIDETPGGSSNYTIVGGTAPYTFEWTLGNVVVSTSQVLNNITNQGTYTLTITDENGCTYTQDLLITGIGEIEASFGVSLNPNPTRGEFVMNISGLAGEKLSYSVVDTQGRVIVKKELGNNSGNRTEFVNVTDIAAGIYYVNVLVGDVSQTLKLIKQ
jgi:hypothetical protein